jgi:hypothetical protein
MSELSIRLKQSEPESRSQILLLVDYFGTKRYDGVLKLSRHSVYSRPFAISYSSFTIFKVSSHSSTQGLYGSFTLSLMLFRAIDFNPLRPELLTVSRTHVPPSQRKMFEKIYNSGMISTRLLKIPFPDLPAPVVRYLHDDKIEGGVRLFGIEPKIKSLDGQLRIAVTAKGSALTWLQSFYFACDDLSRNGGPEQKHLFRVEPIRKCGSFWWVPLTIIARDPSPDDSGFCSPLSFRPVTISELADESSGVYELHKDSVRKNLLDCASASSSI